MVTGSNWLIACGDLGVGAPRRLQAVAERSSRQGHAIQQRACGAHSAGMTNPSSRGVPKAPLLARGGPR